VTRARQFAQRARWPALLLCCVLLGLVGRLWNLDFDQRQHLQPDERHWAITASSLAAAEAPAAHGTLAGPFLDWFDGDRSPANVYRGTESFAYGPVTLAVARSTAGWLHDGVTTGAQPANAVAHAFDLFGVPLIDGQGQPRFDDSYQVDLVGRLLGALLDALTIAVVGLIGRRLGGKRVGLAAAGLYAGSVLAIQHAHFLGAEPLVGLSAALTVLATLRLGATLGPAASPRTVLSGGLLAGAAAGLAVAAKLNGVAVAAVPVLLCALLVVRNRGRLGVLRLCAVVFGAGVAFRLFNPGAFNGLGWSFKQQFLDDVSASIRIEEVDMPPAVQWANRLPYVDPLRWLLMFTVGPGTVGAAVLGAVVMYHRRWVIGRWPVAVVLSAVALPAAVILRSFNPTGRYFMVLLPALHVVAGYGVVAAWRARRSVADAAAASWWARGRQWRWPALALTLAVASGVWATAFVAGVYGHDNTRITASSWIAQHVEPGSVLSLEAWDDGLPLAVPGIDTGQWRSEQFDLFGADDVAKVDRLAGQLVLVDYVVESSPRVWNTVPRIPARYPSTIKFFAALDTGALGFERVATITSPPRLSLFGRELWRLDDSSAEEAFSVYDHPEVRIWQKVRDVSQAELVHVLDPIAASNAIHVSPQDARANGLMLYADELEANEAVGTYADDFDTTGSPWWHAIGWWLLVQLSALAAFVIFLPVFRRLPDAGAGLATMLGLAVPTVGLFAATTWGGLELTRGLVAAIYAVWFTTAITLARGRVAAMHAVWRDRRRTITLVVLLSSVTFVALLALRAANPDLWHPYRAGEKPFELTMLTEVMRTRALPPYDAWLSGGSLNYYYGGYLMLSLPGRLFSTAPTVVMNLALAVFASATTGAAFTAGAAVHTRARRNTARIAGSAARWAGGLAAGFVVLLPNMAVAPEIVGRLSGSRSGPFDWWSLSRVIPDSMAVTEFPAWSLLFGDVHPHVMDLPLLITVLVLCLLWFRALTEHRGRHSLALALTIGALLGLVRATNTWDYPLALAGAIAAAAVAVVRGGRWRVVARDVAIAAAGVVVLWAPYVWRGEVYDGGVEPVTDPTPLHSWLSQWSFFAACTVLVAVAVLWRRVQGSARMWGAVRQGHVVLLAGMLVAAGALAMAPSRATQFVCLALAAVAGATAWLGRSARGARNASLPAAVLAVGWAALAVIEQVSVKNDGGRMNTVFKGWYQAWLLLAIGSAGALVAVAAASRATHAARVVHDGARPALAKRVVFARGAVAALVGIAIATSVAFVVLAVPARLDDRASRGGWSLDGLAFFDSDLVDGEQAVPLSDDLSLLRWLQSNVRGIVPIAEAPGDDYRWSARMATFVGLPTPVGWPYHERQQKRPYGPIIDTRVAEMREMYTTTDPARVAAVLERYGIRYVVFGVAERRLDDDGATVLASPCVSEVFRKGSNFVAEVDRECLSLRRLP